MSESDVVPARVQESLEKLATDLQVELDGAFVRERIIGLLLDSYVALAGRSSRPEPSVADAEALTRQRLEALVKADSEETGRHPGVLFLCVHNAGRSQMALGFFHHLAAGRAFAWSGGSEPASEVNPTAIAAMAEVGIDIAHEFPKPLTDEFVAGAEVVVTMGCGDTCPLVPGKRYEDWDLADPAGKTLEDVRPIRDQIGRRVRDLLGSLGVEVS